MDENIIKEIERLFESSSSEKQLLRSFRLIGIRKTNLKKCLIVAICTFFPAFSVGVVPNTRNVFLDTIGYVMPVILATFSIVFMGYVFFQVLINNELLLHLLKNKNQGKNLLEFSNTTFINIMMFHLVEIVVTLFLMIIIRCIDENFVLLSDIRISNLIATAIIWIYYYSVATTLWEIVPFLYNISQTFKAYAGERVIEMLKKQKQE